jgi:hypothetical protein
MTFEARPFLKGRESEVHPEGFTLKGMGSFKLSVVQLV